MAIDVLVQVAEDKLHPGLDVECSVMNRRYRTRLPEGETEGAYFHRNWPPVLDD